MWHVRSGLLQPGTFRCGLLTMGPTMAVEFAAKDVDATMATMVPSPYVNHIPTMTGGIGYKELHRFYKDFFIPTNPPSLKLRLISRTVGTDRVVDEMYVTFRHTQVRFSFRVYAGTA